MGKSASGIKSKKGARASIEKLNSEMVKLQKDLTMLSKTLDRMLKGDTNGPFWNGRKAGQFYKKAVGNLKNDIADYKRAYKVCNNFAIKYEYSCRGD